MEEMVVISPVDGRKININGLSRKQLRDLHYQEEIQMAKKILSLHPFSEERKAMLNKGYAFVETLKLRYEKPTVTGSFGATPVTVKLVEDIVKRRLEEQGKEQVVYEAGVGMGYAVRVLVDIPGIRYYGCDVALFPELADLCNQHDNLIIHERTLYEDLLEMEDDSIDVFYADNVIEHLLPDEVDSIFKVLYRKMKKKGMLILFIPNWHTGPGDVSMYYLKKGQKATGFHFMEMSYWETIKLAFTHGFKPGWIVKSNKGERDIFWLKNIKRIVAEWAIVKIKDANVRAELMKCDQYNSYIFIK